MVVVSPVRGKARPLSSAAINWPVVAASLAISRTWILSSGRVGASDTSRPHRAPPALSKRTIIDDMAEPFFSVINRAWATRGGPARAAPWSVAAPAAAPAEAPLAGPSIAAGPGPTPTHPRATWDGSRG